VATATASALTNTISNGGIVVLGANNQGGLTYSNLGGAGLQIAPITTFHGGIVNTGTIAPRIAP